MAPKIIAAEQIRESVLSAVGEIFCQPNPETLNLLRLALDRETDELARDMLEVMLDNAELAEKDQVPTCQDTGLLVVFAELGNQVLIADGALRGIIQFAAAEAWKRYYLRNSLAPDPLRGKLNLYLDPLPHSVQRDKSTQQTELDLNKSLPVILHLEQVKGDNLKLFFGLKGGGAENVSVLKMFDPTATPQEIEDFVVETVAFAGGKPCPPVTVGIGIGGDFEYSAVLAKKPLFMPAEYFSGDDPLRLWEKRILSQINQRGNGVQGMGGKTTALAVRILTAPCHIASLPVAVNMDCHSHRCTSRIL